MLATPATSEAWGSINFQQTGDTDMLARRFSATMLPLAFFRTVGQTFLSALKIAARWADKNVCPTEYPLADSPRVAQDAG